MDETFRKAKRENFSLAFDLMRAWAKERGWYAGRDFFHGTKSDRQNERPFTSFDTSRSGEHTQSANRSSVAKPIYVSASLDFANENFAHQKGNEFGYTFSLFVNSGKFWDFENPEMVNEAVAWIDRKFGRDGIGERYRERLERGDREFIESDTMLEFLISNGYDSFHVVEDGTDNIGIFDPARVKSSSIEEFDDAGNEIPLSQRFDITRNDIRYSGTRSGAAADLSALSERPRRVAEAMRGMLRGLPVVVVRDCDDIRRREAEARGGEDGSGLSFSGVRTASVVEADGLDKPGRYRRT